MTFRPRLRTVLLILNLLVLLLPLGGIAALRLYESELVRQTESELISQAALTAAMFRESYLKQAAPPGGKGKRVAPTAALPSLTPVEAGESDLDPIPPSLDLAASRVREPASPAEQPAASPDPFALAAGSVVAATVLAWRAMTWLTPGSEPKDRARAPAGWGSA